MTNPTAAAQTGRHIGVVRLQSLLSRVDDQKRLRVLFSLPLVLMAMSNQSHLLS